MDSSTKLASRGPSTQGRRKRTKFEASDSRRVFGLALLPHELREVVVAARGLAGGPGHLPSAEGLHADDGSGRRARGAVRVQDTGLDLGEEAPQFARFSGKDPSGEPVVDVVRDLDRVLESIDLDHGKNRDEQLLLVDPVVSRQASHDRRIDEVSHLGIGLATEHNLPVRPSYLRDRLLVRGDRSIVDHGPEVHIALSRVPDLQFLRLQHEAFEECVLHGAVDEDSRTRGALLAPIPKRGARHADGGLLQVRDREGEIEGSHDGPHAVRFQHRTGALPREELAHRVLISLLPNHLGGVPSQQVDGLVDVRHRLVPILPVLEGKEGRVRVLSFGDPIRRALDRADPLQVGSRRPTGERRPRGLDRLLRVRSGALLEVAEDDARLRRARVGERRFRPHLLAVDDDRMLVPECRADLVDRGFVVQVKIFRLPEISGVLPRPFVSKFHECNPSGARKAGARIRFRSFRSPDRFGRLVRWRPERFGILPGEKRDRRYAMYVSGDPSYLSYCAVAPIAARSSRAHSLVYEFGGISVVAPSHSKTSLNTARCSAFVRPSSILPTRCSSRFIPRTNSLHWARNFACSSRVMERPASPCGPSSINFRN